MKIFKLFYPSEAKPKKVPKMPIGVHEKHANISWNISYDMNTEYYAVLSFANKYLLCPVLIITKETSMLFIYVIN